MHLYLGIRGSLQQTNLFKMFMQTQMWLWKRKSLKTKKPEWIQIQGGLRECMGGIYEYVFPEEHLIEVLSMLGIPDKTDKKVNKLGFGNFKRFCMRRILGNGVRKIPKFKRVITNRYIETRGVTIYPLGIKKDKREEIKEWGYRQEML